jgi:predicted cobalt transporter CbtA
LDIVTDLATIIGLARDVILLLLLAAALIAVIVIARKVMGLINAVRNTAEKAQEMLETLSEKVVRPAASNPKAFRVLGSVLGFLARRFRRSSD